MKNYKIAVAGTGYVGLSLGVLLSQHHQVVAVDIVQAKVDMINNKKSPIQDDYILKSSIFVKGTQLLIIRKIGKQFAVGLFFKNIHGISSLEIQTIYPCRQISFG